MNDKDIRDLKAFRKAQIESIKNEGMEAVFKERCRRIFSPGFIEKNPDIAGHYRSILLQNDPQAYIRVIHHLECTHKTSDLSRITCPTLIIAGEYDFFLKPSIGETARKSIRGSQLKIFHAGHAPALEQPLEYNETILKFLASLVE